MTPDLDLINHAAAQSDRWMFIALLVIGIAAISVLFKYFTGRFFNVNIDSFLIFPLKELDKNQPTNINNQHDKRRYVCLVSRRKQ